MECVCCGSDAVTERPDRIAQGYRQFRRRDCAGQLNERSGRPLSRAQCPSDVLVLVVLWRLRYRLTLRDLAEEHLTGVSMNLSQLTSLRVAMALFMVTMPASASTPLAKYEPPAGQVYIGVGANGSQISEFTNAVGMTRRPAIWNTYSSGAGGSFQAIFDYVNRNTPGVAPMISWNITMANNSLTNGGQDAYISRQAQAAKKYGKPVFVRPAWEMNGNWYPEWNVSPAQYIASWQRIVNIFNQQGATNVAWAYCPNEGRQANGNPSTFYPGDAYVDWLCFDGYPAYRTNPSDMIIEAWGFDAIADWASTKNKPLMLGEWGRGDRSSTGGADTDTVVNLVFDWAERYPNTVKALVYFDYTPNHRISTAPVAAAAFKARTLGNPRYIYDLAPRRRGSAR